MEKYSSIRDSLFFILIAFFLLIFLGGIFKENNSSTAIVAILVIAITLLLFGFYHKHKRIVKTPFNILSDGLLVIGAILGAIVTSFLNITMHLGPVIAAAAVGVCAGFLTPLISQKKYKSLAPAIYCGAFVGMTAATRVSNPMLIGIAGAIAGVIFVASQNIFVGSGGKLGTIAFIGTTIVMLLTGVLHG